MSKTKRNVFNIVIMSILALFIVVGSVFAFSKIGKNNTSMILHADSTTTNFNGSSVYAPFTPSYFGGSSSWQVSTFSIAIFGTDVWTDGTNYYYSSNSDGNYVLDFSTFTATAVSFSGLTSFYGRYVWTDGTDYYYSSGSSHYVLDSSNLTWSSVTITGFDSFNGSNVYYFNNTAFLSGGTSGTYGGIQYSFNHSTLTWSQVTTGRYFLGSMVCNINGTLYAKGVTSKGGSTATIYKSTNGTSWSNSTSYFTGLTASNFNTNQVWSFNGYYYYSSGSTQKIITEYDGAYDYQLTDYVWSGISNLSDFTGSVVYTTSTNAYLLYNLSYQYYLDNPNIAIRESDNIFDSIKFTFTDNTSTFNISQYSMFYIPYNSSILYSLSDKISTAFSSSTTENDFVNYITFTYNTAYSSSFYIPYYFNGQYYYAQVNYSTSGISNLIFSKITFSSTSTYDSVNDLYTIYNVITYFDNTEHSINFSFVYYSSGSNIVNYMSDSDFTLYEYLSNQSVPTSSDNYIFAFTTRSYYLNSDYMNNDNYNNGRVDGYNIGYNEGFNDGVRDTSGTAYNNGYSAGYSSGVANANHYSFLGLIGAVIDAPVQAFLGLFNFTILGTNVSTFIAALFTIAIVIVIIKKVV